MANIYIKIQPNLEQYQQKYQAQNFSSASNLDNELKKRLNSFSDTLIGKGLKSNGKSARIWKDRIELFDRQVEEFTELIKSTYSKEYLAETRLIDSYVESLRNLVDITFSNNMYIQRKYQDRLEEFQSTQNSLYSKILSSRENLTKYSSLIHHPNPILESRKILDKWMNVKSPEFTKVGQYHILSVNNNEFGLVSETPITERDIILLKQKNRELGLEKITSTDNFPQTQNLSEQVKKESPKISFLWSFIKDTKESVRTLLHNRTVKYACITMAILPLLTLKLNDPVYTTPVNYQANIESLIANTFK
jgi:hypothetical protein